MLLSKMNHKIRNRKGFTLIELIVVVAIIAVLLALLVPSVMKFIESAETSAGNGNAKNAYVAAQTFIADSLVKTGKYPDTLAQTDLEGFLAEAGGIITPTGYDSTTGALTSVTWKKSDTGKEYTYPTPSTPPAGG